LTRSFESNGPDVKIRGTAMHIAEKYVQLARDAQVSGDIVMAENYFQHAEHYFRMIAAAQPQVTTPGQLAYGRDDEGDDEFDGSQRQDFNNRPEPYGQQQPPPPPQRGNGAPYQSYDQGGQRSGSYESRDNRSHESRGPENRGQDNRGYDNRGHEPRSYDNRGNDNRGNDNRGNDNRGNDTRYQDSRGGEDGRPHGDNRPRDSGRPQEGRPHNDGTRLQHDNRYQPVAEPRHGDRPHVNGNVAAAPVATAAPLPGLGPQPDLEPPVVATAAVAAVPAAVPADLAPATPGPALAEDGTLRPRRRSRGSRGRGRRPEGAPGGEEGDDGSPALPFAEDATPTEG
jgi:hypothetical protein